MPYRAEVWVLKKAILSHKVEFYWFFLLKSVQHLIQLRATYGQCKGHKHLSEDEGLDVGVIILKSTLILL